MPRTITQWSLGLTLLAGLTSCEPGYVREERREHRRQMQEMQRKIEALEHAMAILATYVENESRAMWTHQLCKSGKIAEFISELQAGGPGICTAGSLETAMIFLNNLPEATASFYPRQVDIKLPMSREGQLRNLIDAQYVHASTKILIMVQPFEETDAAHTEALAVGNSYIAIMKSLVGKETKLKVLGPYLLPCRLRGEVIKRFQGPMDKPVPGEPTERAPRTRVWSFRVDC